MKIDSTFKLFIFTVLVSLCAQSLLLLYLLVYQILWLDTVLHLSYIVTTAVTIGMLVIGFVKVAELIRSKKKSNY